MSNYLQRGQRVAEVHGELVGVRPAELQGDLLRRVALHHKLEVLHRRLGNPPVEVQHERLNLVWTEQQGRGVCHWRCRRRRSLGDK